MPKLTDLKSLLDAARSARFGDRTPVAPAAACAGAPVAARATMRMARSRSASVAAAKHADGDIDLRQAFADVRRLPPRNRAVADAHAADTRCRGCASPTSATRSRCRSTAPSRRRTRGTSARSSRREQTFLRRGLGTDILGKLRRGHWVVQAELDLHGMTTDEAHDALADFLLEARTHGLRCVRVIHGKGLTSPNREPVLKGKVRRWLAHWDDVLAYCEAPRHAGGGGAVVVLLRGR